MLQRDPLEHGGWLYRSKRPASLNGEAVGYKVFRLLFEAMEQGQMIEAEIGRQFRANSALTGGEWRTVNQQATRFRATPSLRKLFEDQGISHSTWSEHFAPDAEAVRKAQGKRKVSLVLRGGKPPRSTGVTKRPSLPIDLKDPIVASMVSRLEKLNSFLVEREVQPFGPSVYLHRIFSEGHLPDHDWRQGGRLYAPGKGSYQNAKKQDRRAITIDGKTTVELDVRASHLSILVGLGHLPRECLAHGDPYAVEGIPRPVVKQWVTMTISHGKLHRAWPMEAAKGLMKDHGIDARRDFPIKATGEAILAKLPLIQGDGSSVPVGWGELQFRESEILLASMETLAFEHEVPSLPVHDSLIVPVEAEGLAREVLRETFRASLGVVPEVDAGD